MAGSKEKVNVWEHVSGAWVQAQGEIRRHWNRLTDEDMREIHGQYENLVSKIQMRYGISRDEATHQVDKWAEQVKF